ncbi:MAG: cobalamin-binding protein [Chloroflexota bacterium]
MRVVSLVPAGTEIAAALGLLEQLVAVTHDCDFPPAVRLLPRLTRSTIPSGATSREIDTAVRTAGERGESTFHLDAVALREARPDVIVGQTICRVCAVTLEQLPSALPRPPQVIPLDGEDLEGVLSDVRRVADGLGVSERGEQVEAGLRARLAAVAERVAGAPRPAVAFLEWLDPPFNGGHWVPDQIAAAGGRDVLGRSAERSRVVTWDKVSAARPDVLVAALCGFGVRRALDDLALARAVPGWGGIAAVRAGRIYAADGSAYFSRPGPRLVDGVEILAALFHPDLFQAPDPLAAVSAA